MWTGLTFAGRYGVQSFGAVWRLGRGTWQKGREVYRDAKKAARQQNALPGIGLNLLAGHSNGIRISKRIRSGTWSYRSQPGRAQ